MIPKKIYVIDYQLEQCEIDGIADARINVRPYNTINGKLKEYAHIESLWHSVNEPAKELSDIIYVDTEKEVWSTECYSSDSYDDCFGSGWGAYVRNTNLVKWAYKKDLLPFLFKKK